MIFIYQGRSSNPRDQIHIHGHNHSHNHSQTHNLHSMLLHQSRSRLQSKSKSWCTIPTVPLSYNIAHAIWLLLLLFSIRQSGDQRHCFCVTASAVYLIWFTFSRQFDWLYVFPLFLLLLLRFYRSIESKLESQLQKQSYSCCCRTVKSVSRIIQSLYHH